jgi:hypothetical protein
VVNLGLTFRLRWILKEAFGEKWDRQGEEIARYAKPIYKKNKLKPFIGATVKNYTKGKNTPTGPFLAIFIEFVKEQTGLLVDGHWLVTGLGEPFYREEAKIFIREREKKIS